MQLNAVLETTRDQVLRDDTRKAVLDAQERYDAEQRAKEIELLNRDNELKAKQVHQRNLTLALWAGFDPSAGAPASGPAKRSSFAHRAGSEIGAPPQKPHA